MDNNKGEILKQIKSKKENINNATLEECIDTLQFIFRYLPILKEKNLDSLEIGRPLTDLIRQYNEKLTIFITERCSDLEVKNNDNTIDFNNCNINSPNRLATPVSQLSDNENLNDRNNKNFNYPLTPDVKDNSSPRTTTYNSNKIDQNEYIDSVIREDNLPVNLAAFSPLNDTDNEYANLKFQNYESFESPFYMDNTNVQGYEGEFANEFMCVKDFIAKDDTQIDLEVGDIVILNSFSGNYICGKNLRTNMVGLYPIYYIKRLDDHDMLFFRCRIELDNASIGDEIFLFLSDSELCRGYNITRGEEGYFCMDDLDLICMDDEMMKKYEALYNEETNTDVDNNEKHGNSGEESNDEDIQLKKIRIMEKLMDYYNSIDDPLNMSDNLARMREINKKLQEFNSEEKKDEDKEDKKLKEKEIKEKILQKMEDIAIRKEKCKQFENEEFRNEKWSENKNVCKELVESEKKYCENLKILIEIYKKPLEDVVGTRNEVLNNVQINHIFQYVPDIYRLSSKLCEELNEALNYYNREGPIPIANAFLNHLSEWQLYIKYVESYCKALALFDNLNESEQTNNFNRFMERSQQKSYKSLRDLLYLIIDRFRIYNEIYKAIVKNSDPRDSDKYDILETVENFIIQNHKAIDIAKGLQDSINKMFSIVNFPLELISIQRNYIAEWIIKDQEKEKKLYLFNDTVVIAHSIKKNKNKYAYEFEKRIDILDHDITTITIDNKRFVRLIKVDRNDTTTDHNDRSNINHSQYSIIGERRGPSPSIDIIFRIESNIDTNNFIEKYKKQKDILLEKK